MRQCTGRLMPTGLWVASARGSQGSLQCSLLRTQISCQDNSNVLDVKSSHPLSPSFKENSTYTSQLVSSLTGKIARILEGGGQKAIERNRSRGKMLPRERIQALLDPGSPFLELSQLAGYRLYGELDQPFEHSFAIHNTGNDHKLPCAQRGIALAVFACDSLTRLQDDEGLPKGVSNTLPWQCISCSQNV
jgi:hypothetical protein